VLGYSLGARVALRLAIAHPRIVRRLSSGAHRIATGPRTAVSRTGAGRTGTTARGVRRRVGASRSRQPRASRPHAPRACTRERMRNRAGLAASLARRPGGMGPPRSPRRGPRAHPRRRALTYRRARQAVAADPRRGLRCPGPVTHLERPSLARSLDHLQEDPPRAPHRLTSVVDYQDIRYEHSGTGIAR
jgi:pimeloyl-ACP methyl ester carboxylesterase